MTARRTGPLAVALVAAGVLLVVVLVTWAASIGPHDVLRGDHVDPSGSGSLGPGGPIAPPPGKPPERQDPGAVQSAVRVLAAVVYVVILALGTIVVVMLLQRGRRLLRERSERRRGVAPDDQPFDVLTPAEAVGDELLADADAQRAALEAGSPRNAIVECWHRFEVAAATAGLERRVWETSAEFTIRVLDLVDADAGAVSRLAVLYREARFSAHEVSEADRAAALAALDDIHRTIRRPAGATP